MQNEGISLTEHDLARQAIHSLGGYVYQIYQSLRAWLDLKENEILFLEVAEDYAVLKDLIFNRVQIKNIKASGNITLRSESVKALIVSHWHAQNANPTKKITSTFLTTADIGQEQNLQFPNKKKGLEYWEIASRKGVDVEPIRHALLQINLPSEIHQFIANSESAELKERFLISIKWCVRQADLESLKDSIQQSLINLGEKFRMSPQLSESRLPWLFSILINSIFLETSKRQFSRAELLRAFTDSTIVPVPFEEYAELVSRTLGDPSETTAEISTNLSFVSEIPRITHFAERAEIRNELSSIANSHGIVWLHGSNGVGKTVLACELAKSSNVKYMFCDLRGCESGDEVRLRLSSAARCASRESANGVVLDDLPAEHVESCIRMLSLLHFNAQRLDTPLIITSSRKPAPEVLSKMGLDAEILMKINYLTKTDVAEIVISGGADAQVWAVPIFVSTGGGHPMLVAARVQGLKSRDWPVNDLKTELFEPSEEIQNQIDLVLLRLMSELPQNSRDLLFRLCLPDTFDRQLAKEISGEKPSVHRAMEAFAYLNGPWVETRGTNLYAVSPLVKQLGHEQLDQELQSSIRSRIAENLMNRKPFPAEQIFQLFLNAHLSSNVSGLFWFAMIMIHNSVEDREVFKRLAEIALPLIFFKTSYPLAPKEIPFLPYMLRVTQGLVASSAENEQSRKIYQQISSEYHASSKDEAIAGMYLTAITFALFERTNLFPTKQWFELVEEVKDLEEIIQNSENYGELKNSTTYFDNALSLQQVLFSIQSSSLSSVKELVELFGLLDHLDAEKREYYISALVDVDETLRLTIEMPFLNESRNGALNAFEAEKEYLSLSKIAERWGNQQIEVFCIAARIIVVDEYGQNAELAQQILDEALLKYPKHAHLLRRQQFLLLRQGKHQSALDAFSDLQEVLSRGHNVDRIYSLRDAGASAAKVGDLDLSKQYFMQSLGIALESGKNLKEFAVGLHGDIAIVEFLTGNFPQTIEQLKSALALADDPILSKKLAAKVSIQMFSNLFDWMSKTFSGQTSNRIFEPGDCTNADSLFAQKTLPETASVMRWYFLANLELEFGLTPKIWHNMRTQANRKENPPMEVPLSQAFILNACKQCNILDFSLELPHYLGLQARCNEITKSADVDAAVRLEESVQCEADSWANEKYWALFTDCVICFSICEVMINDYSKTKELSKRLTTQTTNPRVFSFLNLLTNENCTEAITDMPLGYASAVAFCRRDSGCTDTANLFNATWYIWNWLRDSHFGTALENEVVDFLSCLWKSQIANKSMNTETSLQIERAFEEGGKQGIPLVADILLACSDLLTLKLSPEAKQLLVNCSHNSF